MKLGLYFWRLVSAMEFIGICLAGSGYYGPDKLFREVNYSNTIDNL